MRLSKLTAQRGHTFATGRTLRRHARKVHLKGDPDHLVLCAGKHSMSADCPDLEPLDTFSPDNLGTTATRFTEDGSGRQSDLQPTDDLRSSTRESVCGHDELDQQAHEDISDELCSTGMNFEAEASLRQPQWQYLVDPLNSQLAPV